MKSNNLVVNSYEKCESKQDVLDALSRNDASESLMLWQTRNEGRNIFWIRSWEIDHKNERLIIFYEADKTLKVNPEFPMYIKVPFREAILKSKVEISADNYVYLKIPSELFWREFREHPRLPFDPIQKKAEIRLHGEGVSPEKLKVYQVLIKDISQDGLGLVVSGINHKIFKKDLLIEIISLDGVIMMTPIIGHIVYCVKEKVNGSSKGDLHKVGIKMLRPFQSDMLKKLIAKLVHAPKASPVVDFFSEEFVVMVEKEVKVTLARMKSNPAIAKYLRQLEISRGTDQDLEEHIKVLCVVCTFIARSMNWLSDVILQKLIYVAHLHDAPLFGHPKLLQIHNLEEFENVKRQLTLDERRIFLGAPTFARAIAVADKFAPPDASTILLMQKELPNGSGFPRHLSANKITPMAAVFIVAHDLTDELMLNKDWNIDSWLNKARPIYRGGIFSKIMETLENHKFAFKKPSVKTTF